MQERFVVPWAAALAVMVFGVVTALGTLNSSLPVAPDIAVVLADVAAGWSFSVVGAVLWLRFPGNRIGALAVLVGFASLIPDIRWFETSLTWTLGSALADVHLVVLAWLILAFPTGHLDIGERGLVIGVAIYFSSLAIAGHLFEEPAPGCEICPSSFLLVRADPALNEMIWGVAQMINLIIIGVLVAMIIRKWNRATPVARRGLGPVVWALGPIGLTLASAFLEPLVGLGDSAGQTILIAERVALIVFPLALGVGMVRTRLDQAKVADLARSVDRMLGPGELENRVGAALGDPSARLGFWSERSGGLFDVAGRPLEASADAEVAIFSRDGERLGSILHDPAVDPTLAESVGATVTLALHNERLQAELRRKLIEVEESRVRITEAAMAERTRIERDLHDGAQQGLLALGASLGSIRRRADGDVAQMLDEAIDDLRRIIEDLRELARGVHPPILSERGLGPAIETLAERSPVPVTIDVTAERCRPAVEAAAYFLVAEAMANATRHATPNNIGVVVAVANGWLRVVVSDDGDGGATVSSSGTGLQGLIDRVSALGGELSVMSSPDSGTAVEAVLPCG